MAFNITTNISMSGIGFYVYADTQNPTSIENGGTATLTFYADGTYYTLIKKLADAISITGATVDSWTTATPFKVGTLVISNPTQDVTITLTPKQVITPLQYGKPFQLSAKAPIDTRIVLTKKQMLETTTGKQPDVYFCICKDDGKLYIWNNTFTKSSETGFFKAYDEILNIVESINKALELPETKQQLEQAIADTLPGALTNAMATPEGAEQIANTLFDSDHFQTTVDNKIDLAISVIQAIDGNKE